MLLMLSQWLQGLSPEFGFFRVFQYLTFRAVMAAMTALLIGLIAGPKVIRVLTSLKIGQPIRGYAMQSHLSKSGTPTMGGVLILLSIAISTLLWFDLSNRFVWIVLIVTLGFGAIGWVDDWRKVVHRNPKGLSAKAKMAWQSVIGIVAVAVLAYSAKLPQQTELIVPFFKTIAIPLGTVGFMIIGYFMVVGFSNAVNLTDGLDGLAIMPTVMIASALAVFAYVSGHAGFAKYLGFPLISGAGELAVLCGAMAGAGLAFVWFSASPAEVFMGDVGALALGAALGMVALVVRQEIVLLIMAGVFVVETLSVIIQVASFKLTGKRVFRMAPLHHHYELKGWKENQVVVRFWIITMMLVLVGLSSLKLR